MSETKEIACIVCPRGCALTLAIDGEAVTVTGYACPRGESYGAQEAVCPMRSLTTTVRTSGSSRPRLPVRTNGEMPLARVREAMAAIDAVTARAPLSAGDLVLGNLLGLGVDLIATDDLEREGERDGR